MKNGSGLFLSRTDRIASDSITVTPLAPGEASGWKGITEVQFSSEASATTSALTTLLIIGGFLPTRTSRS
jgi:hypothetical protein